MRIIHLAVPIVFLALVGCGQAQDAADEPATASGEDAAPETAPAEAASSPASGDFETDHHRFEEVAPGVYFVTYTVPNFFNSNSMVIVNDADVVVVDSHITPATGRELIADIGRITDKPISVVVNTHFHYDHAHGNQAFESAKIIGHEFTRMKMAGTPLAEPTFAGHVGRISAGIEGLQRQIAEAASGEEGASEDAAGGDVAGGEDDAAGGDAEQKQVLEAQLAALQAHMATVEETTPRAPDVTLNERITLYRGDREIQLIFCGRAHTGGDIVVYLPNERLVFTGDMMLNGPSWLGDGHVDEWPATLENLKALDFELILPGHGPAFSDRGRIDLVQDYYRALWADVAALHGDGKSAAEAAATVDLTQFKDSLGIARAGADPQAVARIYRLLDAGAAADA